MIATRPVRFLAASILIASAQPLAAAAVPSLEEVLRIDRGPSMPQGTDPEAAPALDPSPRPIGPQVGGIWSDEFAGPSGTNGIVWALTDFDGAIVTGGEFTRAGDIPADRIAAWDGTAWQALGAGLQGTVFALGVHAGSLYAGGDFTTSGSTPVAHIARWNGVSWQPVGGGTNGSVRVLLSRPDGLYVGGDFSYVGSVSAHSIARWDGTAWQSLGPGLTGGLYGLGVRAIVALGSDIVAGGFFTAAGYVPLNHLGRWNGTGWSALGSWTNEQVYSLVEQDGRLVAGSVVWSEGSGTWANLIASFDGASWSPLGDGALAPPFSNAVRSLAIHDGALVASGRFRMAGGVPAPNVARWTGASWVPLGSGLSDHTTVLLVHAGQLVAGGEFVAAGGVTRLRVAVWDGVAWGSLGPGGHGMNGAVWALVEWQGKVVAGGEFTAAGSALAAHVAVWDGTGWSALGSGLPGTVYALAVFEGDLVAGGSFDAGSIASIARWDGATWVPLGSGTNGAVRALLPGPDGLYVGGDFSYAGGGPASQVARWNGATWSPIGTGLSGSTLGVRALLRVGDDVVAGGFFTEAGPRLVDRLAGWNGVEWKGLGSWSHDAIYSLAMYAGRLVAGSVVWSEGAGGWENMIARAEGDVWSPLGSGPLAPPFANAVRALAQYNGDLVTCGFFPLAAGLPVNHVARWDGAVWAPLGDGLDGNAVAFLAHGGRLFVGGEFTHAGGLASNYIASWLDDIPIPVEVEDLVADATPERVRLAWRLAAGMAGVEGVIVESAVDEEGPFVPIHPGRLAPAPAMQLEDFDVEPGRSVWYRLLLVRHAGGVTLAAALRVDVPVAPPLGTGLVSVREPSGGGPVEMRFTVGPRDADRVRIAVHDARGRLVRVLSSGERAPGSHVLGWNRLDDGGRPVARGVYFVGLSAASGSTARKLVLVRD